MTMVVIWSTIFNQVLSLGVLGGDSTLSLGHGTWVYGCTPWITLVL